MAEGPKGDVVNVSSGADRHPFPQYPSCVASKYGVRGFTGSALNDLRGTGVRVTMVAPGEVDTPMQTDEAREAHPILDPGDVADAIVWRHGHG